MADPVQPAYMHGDTPVFNQASPGIHGALFDAIRVLSQALAPRSIVQQPAREAGNEAVARGDATSQPVGLGQHFTPR